MPAEANELEQDHRLERAEGPPLGERMARSLAPRMPPSTLPADNSPPSSQRVSPARENMTIDIRVAIEASSTLSALARAKS
jgi:hypothetical protein